MTAYNVARVVVAVIDAASPAAAEAALGRALRGHGFDAYEQVDSADLPTFISEPDAPAAPLPPPCHPREVSP